MVAAEPTRFTWTTTTYELAFVAGIFGPDPRCELVDGEVLLVTPMLPPHAWSTRALRTAVYAVLGSADVTIGSQEPVILSERDMPEPDVWVASGSDAGRSGHPGVGELLLVCEIAQSSLVGDLNRKVPRYAAAGVPLVVVLDIIGRRVMLHEEPDTAASLYRRVTVFETGDRLRLDVAGASIAFDVDAIIAPSR